MNGPFGVWGHKIDFPLAKIGAVSTEPLGSFGIGFESLMTYAAMGSWARLEFSYGVYQG